MNRYLMMTIGLFAALALSGCAAVVFVGGAAAGGAGAVWYRGQLRTTLAGPLPRVRDAASATLEKMGHGVSAADTGAAECMLSSFAGDGRDITVELKSISPNITEVHIRVGFWGDQAVSQSILDQIESRLGQKPA